MMHNALSCVTRSKVGRVEKKGNNMVKMPKKENEKILNSQYDVVIVTKGVEEEV